jgi:very-short-patch-repair endonuclease
LLGLPRAHRTEPIIAAAIDQLAGAAARLWPIWFGGEDFSELNDNTLSHHYLTIKLASLRQRFPSLSAGWAETAIRQVLHGRSPRVPGAAAEIEWSQLCHAVNPNGLIAVVTLEGSSPQSTLPVVRAFEWLAANANVAIAILCRELPPREPPFDRLMYGAQSVRPEILLPTQVENAASEVADEESFDVPSVTLLLPPVHGRPHPQSAIEQRLSKMIEADAELMSKFVFNARVEDASLKSPKVDLLWAEGRLVIELDGDEHRGRRAYRDDRHRDYELLCAGYAVVRIPNDEIVEDFARALEKIRSIVRLRSCPTEG